MYVQLANSNYSQRPAHGALSLPSVRASSMEIPAAIIAYYIVAIILDITLVLAPLLLLQLELEYY